MKRRLGSKYSELVKYINERKDGFEIMRLCKEILEETDNWTQDTPDTEEYKMIFLIYNGDFDWPDRDKLVPIIVDIYNDNYELEEPKYYWQLKDFMGRQQSKFYLTTRVGDKFIEGNIMLTDTHSSSIKKFTKSEIESGIHDATLTIDNFTPVKEIEND